MHLSRAGAEVGMFAPDIQQMHVMDHTKGCPEEDEARSLDGVLHMNEMRNEISDLMHGGTVG